MNLKYSFRSCGKRRLAFIHDCNVSECSIVEIVRSKKIILWFLQKIGYNDPRTKLVSKL